MRLFEQPGPKTARDAAERSLLFQARGLEKSYTDGAGHSVQVLRDVSLEIREGEVTGIVGPSGFGKSTLLHILGALDHADGATVLAYRGVSLLGASREAARRHRANHVSFVFQDLNLVTHLTAEENAALPLIVRGVPWARAVEQASEHLQALGIAHLADRRPAELSGGERQRVAIARGFASEAPVILADEPTGSLDPENSERVMRAFCELARARRKAVVIVTHNVALAHRYCDRVLECRDRRLVEANVEGRVS